jgi:hypothetical protein
MNFDFNTISALLKNAEIELGIKIIYIIYNENKEIEMSNISLIINYIRKMKCNSAMIILEGIGGDCRAGQELTLYLKSKFTANYFIAIPHFVKSALVFPIFAATALFMDEFSNVSPVEPLIKNKLGICIRPESTLTLMKSDNIKQANHARIKWTNQANFVLFLLEELPMSIIHESKGMNINQIYNIITLFLCSPHNRKITKAELKKVGFYCWDVKGKSYWDNINKFTGLLKAELIKNKQIDFIIGDTKSYIDY